MPIPQGTEGIRARIAYVCFFFAVLGGAPARVWGADAAVEAYVRALESSYRGVRTLRAEFTQTYVWGGRKRVESGTVHFARGGRMRWDYSKPIEKLFLSDGKKIFFYIPEDHQVTRTSMKSSEDFRVPFRLLLSRLDLRKIFSRIEFADQALDASPGNRVLRGIPKRALEEAYEQVLFEVAPSADIHRLVVFYPDRSSMEFIFRQIEKNVALSPSLFLFTPPPGTEVIDQR
ncbi:MAG: outer membrane lipoprotein chaperone LolA [Acidobacteria bacterium]|nr:outer membrane lipoprotein chaperone LolA [Acidobacteriota bacterium]